VLALALALATFAASADQSGNPGGLHEIPPFVRERVELLSGAPDDRAEKGDRADRAAGDAFFKDYDAQTAAVHTSESGIAILAVGLLAVSGQRGLTTAGARQSAAT
jgi:hypothetical protein